MASKPKDSGKTMDVSKPGDSAPDTSARPVIVTHRPMVQDPMMVPSGDDKTANAPTAPKLTNRASKVIKPITETPTEESAPVPAADVTEETKPVPEPDAAKEETTETKTDTAEEAEKPVDKSEDSNEEAVVDAVADQAEVSSKKEDAKAAEAAKARQAELDKLVAEKKYFLPIGAVTRRKHNQKSLIVLLLLVVGVVIVYLLLDANIIRSGIKLPVNIIK